MVKTVVVKSNRKKEEFNPKKLYKSIHNACRAAQVPKGECDKTAKKIYKDVIKILHKQHCWLSEEVEAHVAKHMKKKRKDLAFMYKSHKDLS